MQTASSLKHLSGRNASSMKVPTSSGTSPRPSAPSTASFAPSWSQPTTAVTLAETLSTCGVSSVKSQRSCMIAANLHCKRLYSGKQGAACIWLVQSETCSCTISAHTKSNRSFVHQLHACQIQQTET